MTAYSAIINRTVEEAMSADGFDATALAPKVFKKIGKSDRERTSIATITRDLKDAANNIAKRAVKQHETAQIAFQFFPLPGAVALDLEGHKIKFTRSLSRMEFKRAKAIRKDHHLAAGEAVKVFEDAEKAFNPYWDQHPDWNAGQCMDQLVEDRSKGDAA